MGKGRATLLSVLATLALTALPSAQVQAYNVTLRVATAYIQNNDLEKGFWTFIEKVKKLSDGQIKIQYIGGPEALPPFEQVEAVRSGTVDISTNAGSYFSSIIPEGDALKLSELTPWEERANGATGLITNILSKKGIHYIGRYNTPGLTFNYYTIKKVEKLSDLNGLRMRISPLYKGFANALGLAPVQLAHSEIYTALERGMLDGIGASNIGMSQQGHQKFLKYVIEPGFYNNDQVIIMNLKSWEKLPEEARKIIDQAIQETEHESSEGFIQLAKKEREVILASGVQEVALSEAEKSEYLDLAKQKGWEELMKVAPVNGPELKRLLTK